MQILTTVLELLGALVVIAGICLLLLPLIGAGWVAVIAGCLLIGLASLVEALQ